MRRRVVSPRSVVVAVLAALAGGACSSRPSGVIAEFTGGEVTRDEVEERVLELPEASRRPAGGDFAAWYEQLARRQAVAELLVERAEGGGLAVTQEYRDRFGEARRQLLAAVVVSRRLSPIAAPDAAELRRYLEEHQELFARQAARLVYHLFLQAGEDRERTRTRALELRRRVLEGQSFPRLAAEHSDSELRHREGLMGWVRRGDLPAPLETIVFALEETVPSEVLERPEGFHLFWVEQALEAQSPTLDEVRPLVIAHWSAARRREALRELELPALPEASFVPEAEELFGLMRDGSPDALVLRVGDFELRLDELRERLVLLPAPSEFGTPRPEEIVEDLALRERLVLWAEEHGVAEEPTVARGLDSLRRRELEELARRDLVREWLELAPQAVEEFFAANARRYDSALRLRLEALIVPVGGRPGDTVARLEAAVPALDRGEESLAGLAAGLGGRVRDLGWNELGGGTLPSQATRQLASLPAGRHTAPYRRGDTLEVLRVAERQEPGPRHLEAVRERVIEDYLGRHGAAALREAEDRMLQEARFRVLPDAVAALVAPGQGDG